MSHTNKLHFKMMSLKKMSHTNKLHFKMMSFVHETLYGLFRDPYKVLRAAGLEPGQKVLEVGCGPGFFTIPAARIVGEEGSVLAFDINPVAVEHVRRKIEEAGATNARVIVADATTPTPPKRICPQRASTWPSSSAWPVPSGIWQPSGPNSIGS